VLGAPLADKLRSITLVPTTAPIALVPPSPTVPDPPPESAPQRLDAYEALSAECRILGQRLRAMRERREEIDAEIEVLLAEYEEKRGRLLAIMDEGVTA